MKSGAEINQSGGEENNRVTSSYLEDFLLILSSLLQRKNSVENLKVEIVVFNPGPTGWTVKQELLDHSRVRDAFLGLLVNENPGKYHVNIDNK